MERRSQCIVALLMLILMVPLAGCNLVDAQKLKEADDLVASIQTLEQIFTAERADLVAQIEKFKEEKDSLVEGFEKKAEMFPEIGLCFYAIKARHENIKSYVINEISEMRPHKTIILLQFLQKGRVRFSARRQDGKIKVNDIYITHTSIALDGEDFNLKFPQSFLDVQKHFRLLK